MRMSGENVNFVDIGIFTEKKMLSIKTSNAFLNIFNIF